MKSNPRIQICTVANFLYLKILDFEKSGISDEQQKLIDDIKVTIEQSIGIAKYSTQTLADYKKKTDPNYNIDKFFDDSIDYAKEIKETCKNIKDLELEEIDFKKPDKKWSKYKLVDHYERVYKLAHLIPLNDEIIKAVERAYFLSYRISKKIDEYRKKYGGGEELKSKSIDYHARKFKELNLQRHNRNLVKEENGIKYFDDGSIWNRKEQYWIKPPRTIDDVWNEGK